MIKRKELKEGVHFYYNEKGLMVFTEKYHLERGFCCSKKRGDKKICKHCPYQIENPSSEGFLLK